MFLVWKQLIGMQIIMYSQLAKMVQPKSGKTTNSFYFFPKERRLENSLYAPGTPAGSCLNHE